jgi:diguanylate cyclase (GGDEF)-like protein
LAEALPIGVCHLRPDHVVVYANAPLVELLGPIASIDDLLACASPADRDVVRAALDLAFAGLPAQQEIRVFRLGEERRCELTARAMTDVDGVVDGIIVCAADVTDRSRLRQELEHRANHDDLTGCLNRAATAAAVERFLLEPQRVAVAFIDLDDFKAINDEVGHAAGDELLRIATNRMRSVTREGDLLGRLGGDEFIVVCAGEEAPDPDELAERLTGALNGGVVVNGLRLELRASVGAAISLDGELGGEALLQRADTAMYAAKRKTRATYVAV